MAPRKKKKPLVARVDPYTPESGLFRVRPKNAPRLESHEYTKVITKTEDGELLPEPFEIRYTTPYGMNHVDMRIFYAAVALCCADPQELRASDTEDANLWSRFLAVGNAGKMPAARTRTTSYQLCKTAGVNFGGNQARRASESLEKLAAVSTSWRQGKRVAAGANMLSFIHDEETKELEIAVSPLLAKAIFGEAGRYLSLSIEEMHQLKHPAAVIMHATLTNRLGVGGSKGAVAWKVLSLDSLARIAYGKTADVDLMRERRKQIRAALEELDKLGLWFVGYGRGKDGKKVVISRCLPGSEHLLELQSPAVEKALEEPVETTETE